MKRLTGQPYACSKNETPTFDGMEPSLLKTVTMETVHLQSHFLKRTVTVDFYKPHTLTEGAPVSLLLINDGQDLPHMNFVTLLDQLHRNGTIQPVLCAGIYASEDRKMEYGTAKFLDYDGRGAKAAHYTQFILEELLPYIHTTYKVSSFQQRAFAGFSLGGLMALDAAWNYPCQFSVVAVFSGSLWWRLKALHDGYDEATDRIMHKQIREGKHQPHQRFYFMTGSLDETSDRNNNGIIDSIDDTLALIEELRLLGYTEDAVHYINYEDGKHDVETWGRAMPHFLAWAFQKV